MSFREKCSVMGVWNHKEASFFTYLGLYALQHRGQEGAGIVSLNNEKHISKKAEGLVRDIFFKSDLDKLKGNAAIGHTRYSTTGESDSKNLQPLYKNLKFGPVSIAHNGNIVNYKKFIDKNSSVTSDTECILSLLKQNQSEDFHYALMESLNQLEGAFSLTIMTKNSLIAVRDSKGFRPLVLGKKEDTYIIASETCALDLIGAVYIREIKEGEVLTINKNGLKSDFLKKQGKKARCIFEYVYFSRPDSFVFGRHVYDKRKKMGMMLAKEHPVDADLVIPVPDSGIPAAIGYANESKIPFEMGIIRNHYIGRTFIHPSQSIRNFRVKIKLNPQSHIINGKRIIAVDDSVVRGTTSKSLVEILRQAGAKEVHLRISSPPIKGPCFYGIDTPQKKQLIINQYSKNEDLKKYLNVDSIAYLSQKELLKSCDNREFCMACFDEKYPTKIYNEL